MPPPYPAYSIYSTRHERRSQTQDLPIASHSSYHDKTAASVRTHCPCWSISRPLAGSTSSYQLSVCGLATPAWRLVDQDEPGFERLSSTSSSTISASTRRGSVRRNVPSGVNSWRRPYPVKDAPLDDDDDDDDDDILYTTSEIESDIGGNPKKSYHIPVFRSIGY